MAFDPEQIWSELSSTKSSQGWMIKRLDPSAKIGLILGVHHPECQPSLLVETHSGVADEGRDWPSTRGVEVKPDRWGDTKGIRLTLTEPSLKAVFGALVRDLAPLANQQEPDKKVRARLDSWLALLSRRRQEGLNRDEQVALLSELEVFRRLSSCIPIPALVHGWEGPLDDRGSGRGLHDFRLCGARVEVKATARTPVHTVTISRHAQLDPDAIGNDGLILAVACWSMGVSGGITLPAMISSVRALAEPHPLAVLDLEDRLRASGWIDSDSELYECRSWRLLEIRWYEVIDEFPRLRCRDLPRGIVDGEYSISLLACEPWRREESQALNIARGKAP